VPCWSPEHRGRGLGTAAQRLFVGYLFATTLANRLQAITDVENLAEQRALERIGFRRQGVRRGLAFIGGQWRTESSPPAYGATRPDQTTDSGLDDSSLREVCRAIGQGYRRRANQRVAAWPIGRHVGKRAGDGSGDASGNSSVVVPNVTPSP
jgi:hypothetical protein